MAIAARKERSITTAALRWLAGTAFLTLAIALGILLGGRWLAANNRLIPEQIRHGSYLDLGGVFPNYVLADPRSGLATDVLTLSHNAPLLLILAGRECPHCEHMMKHWRKKVLPHLTDGIQVALIFDAEDWSGADPTANGLVSEGIKAYVTDRRAQIEDDGLAGTPLVVGLGTDGRIRFISPGDNPLVGSEFINKYIR
jgi:hypothetical protein